MSVCRSYMVVAIVALGLCLAACGEDDPPATPDTRVAADAGPDRGVDAPGTQDLTDLTQPDQTSPADLAPPDATTAKHSPVIFVHGVNGSSANYKVMIQRLVADGWPKNLLFTIDFADPKWGCNLANAKTVQSVVKQVLVKTGHARVDLVAHSMGTLSTRYFMKNLGGHKLVDTYVTLGGMHHGLMPPCLSPLDVCVWKELCSTGPFMTQLNKAPATPGKSRWVSIYGTADTTVPNSSSKLTGAENIQVKGVAHSGATGLLEHKDAYAQVKRVLQYPPWK